MKSLYCQCMTKPTTIKKKRNHYIVYFNTVVWKLCLNKNWGEKEDLLESPKRSSRSLGLLHHSVVVQLLSRVRLFCDPMDCDPSGSSVHGISQARILEWVAIPPPGDLPEPGIKPRSPALQVDSLPSDPPGKAMNTAVGSLFLLQAPGSKVGRDKLGNWCCHIHTTIHKIGN